MCRRLIPLLCFVLAGSLIPGCIGGASNRLFPRGVISGRASRGVLSPLSDRQLYINPQSEAAVWWRENRLEYPDAAEILRRMATMPTAMWLKGLETPTEAESATGISTYLRGARAVGRLPSLVLYNIVGRDAAGLSRGGAADAAAYRRFVNWVDDLVGDAPALIIIEPDALAQLRTLTPAETVERSTLLRYAASHLARPGRYVYLDAGHAGWLPPATAAELLRRCGVEAVQGFALNVSNFRTLDETLPYAQEIARRLGGSKTAVIDTSRSGNGAAPHDAWCNPPGRALGPAPTTQTAYPIDALLWVKRPWESDGEAAGAPPAGCLYLTYALDLARNAGWQSWNNL